MDKINTQHKWCETEERKSPGNTLRNFNKINVHMDVEIVFF